MPAVPPAPDLFWLLAGEEPTGPFTVPQIHAELAAGRATWQTPACPVGGSTWLPLARTPGVGPGESRQHDAATGGSAAPPPAPPPAPLPHPAPPRFPRWVLVAGVLLLACLPPLFDFAWQTGVGLLLVGLSAPGLFASRDRLRRLSATIGTSNPLGARLACAAGLSLGVLMLAAAVTTPVGERPHEADDRPAVERAVREQMERQSGRKVEAVELRRVADGFVGEARGGEAVWDVRVTVRGGGIAWEAQPRVAPGPK